MFPPLLIVVEPKTFRMSPVRMTWVLTVLVMLIVVGTGPVKSVVGWNPPELDELTLRFATGCATKTLMLGMTRA